jgi:hypothetical protein
MDWIREAESVLRHYRDLTYALKNLNHQIARLTWKGTPHELTAAPIDQVGVSGSGYSDDAMNIAYQLMMLQQSKKETQEEIKRIDNILAGLDDAPGCENYSQVLKYRYIEQYPMEEVAGLLNYSANSRRSVYGIKNQAIRKFAVRYFGLPALKAI